MRKLLKSCLAVLVMVCVAFGFTACGTKLSETTTDVTKVKTVNGVSTNGGITAIYDNYLYYVNGTKECDGKNLTGNTKSAICRIQYDAATGTVTGESEVVVDNLVGFTYGSIRFFGDFMYYATPCSEKNYAGDVLYNKTTFMRYDLVNKKSYKIFTTNLNSADEVVSYSYYIVGNSINLLVYETNNATITSVAVGKKPVVNYVIEDVTGCLFSENNGVVEIEGATADANSYVFYTKAPVAYEAVQTGSKVFRTSPVIDDSYQISIGYSVKLESIMAGNLITSCNEKVYCHAIKGATTDTLIFGDNCISYVNYENAIFLEHYAIDYVDVSGTDVAKLVKRSGHVSVLYITDEPYYVMIIDWLSGYDIGETISRLGDIEEVQLFGLTQIEEIVEEDDESTEDVNEEVKRTAVYAVYAASDLVYKVEVAVIEDANTMKISHWTNAIQMSSTKVAEVDGLLVPEIIGSYMFVFSEDTDKNVYMYKIDLTPTETTTKAAMKVALAEK